MSEQNRDPAVPEKIVTDETEQSKEKPFGHFTRRTFIAQLGAAGIAATATPSLAAAATQEAAAPSTREATIPVTLSINGKKQTLNIDPRATLLDSLRERLHLTGTKKGCDHGQCGACTVHVNGRRVNSCLSFARCMKATRSRRSKASASPATCIRCRRRSSSTTAISAATAPPGRSCRRSRC